LRADSLDKPFVGVPEWLLRWQPPKGSSLRLTLADKLVWAAFRDRIKRTGPALSYGYMARFLGTSARVTRRSVRKLEAVGLLRVGRSAKPLMGRRSERLNRYTVVRPEQSAEAAANSTDTVPSGVPEQCPNGPVDATIGSRHGCPNGPVDATVSVANTNQTEDRQQTGAVAAAGDDGEVERMLVALGVEPRVAAAEAARPDVTAELVRAAARWADERRGLSNRAGFILKAIRGRPPELLHRVESGRREGERLRKCQADAEALERDRRTVARIPDSEWAAVTKDACRQIRDRWPLARPEPEIERAGRSADLLSPLLVWAIAKAWAARNGGARDRKRA